MHSRWTHRVMLAALLVSILLAVLPGSVVRAAVYTVGTAADGGSGSLREAINNVNTGAYDTINFAIGSGVQTIALTSPLPSVNRPVTINGATQPGYAGTPLIEVRGTGAGAGAIGFQVFGGNSTIIALAINGFAGSGIYISTAGNVVRNCYIGTDVSGTVAVANTVGINVIGANNNTIGGSSVARNVISGNSNSGIFVGSGASGTRIAGNYIGTNAGGTAAIPNPVGIFIFGASNTIIGDTATGGGNLISGNTGNGVSILDAAPGTSQSNYLLGNFIGTNPAGTAAIPNGFGITISNASGNVIGGTAAGARNLISGNTKNGVSIDSGSGNSTFNFVQGNFIGTDVTGTVPIYIHDQVGQDFGVGISATVAGTASNNNTIGGTSAAARNIISGNFDGNVAIVGIGGTATANVVQGNYVGTDVTGSVATGHCDAGVYIRGAGGNIIGGTAPGAGNIISGNSRQGLNSTGLAIDASESPADNNIVQGNLIGTDKTGTVSISNGAGIYLAAASNNTIGGTTPAARNIISGNSISNGLAIDGHRTNGTIGVATGNVVQGNYIGTSPSGTTAVGNGVGITLTDASGNTIGGTAAGAGNTISGNITTGLNIYTAEAAGATQNNVIQGNFVGTNAAGTAAVANGGIGIGLASASNNLVGGAASGARNVISGNRSDGIFVNGALIPSVPGTGNLIQSNGSSSGRVNH